MAAYLPPPQFNTEVNFVMASVNEFIKTWASGKQGSMSIECGNGRAWLQLGFQLSQPYSYHYVPQQDPNHWYSSRSPKSAKRRERDNIRATKYKFGAKQEQGKISNKNTTVQRSMTEN